MSGEILGIAGIAGSGQRELLECIAGLYPVEHGTVTFLPEGKPGRSELIGKTPNQIRKAGVAMAFVPEDRLGMGLVGSMGMGRQHDAAQLAQGQGRLCQPHATRTSSPWRSWRSWRSSRPASRRRCAVSPAATCRRCSSAAKSRSSPSVLLTAYAVRGLDINTSYTIYNLLTQQKMKGVSRRVRR